MSFKVKDHYFNKAKKENFVARSIYKLEEIDNKYKLLQEGMSVLDLGYHPGSWVQYSAKKVGDSGKVVGIDIKPVNKKIISLTNVDLFEKDINDLEGPQELGQEGCFDIVISDMAPNTSGIKNLDQIRSLGLIEMIFHRLHLLLRENGDLCFKIFDSNDAQKFAKDIKRYFNDIYKLKPKSTRSVSKEFFVICKGYNLKKYEEC